jgi:hypothetical protein
MIRYLTLVTLLLLPSFGIAESQTEASLEVGFEHLYFPKEIEGLTERHQSSITLQPEFRLDADNGRQVFQFTGFYRADFVDDERSHGDIREASIVQAMDDFEIRAGISRVFWGVTESQHLVDIINQTDQVENPRGQDKLGQPMLNPTIMTEYGVFSGFLLPYFRERSFPGEGGRFLPELSILQDEPLWQHEKEERHVDFALRYTHSIGDLDLGGSWFEGTDRQPRFVPGLKDSSPVLRPYYVQIRRTGLDMQYIWQDWLLKLEAIHQKDDFADAHTSSTLGFEYTLGNIGPGIDIGFLLEYLHDDRGSDAGGFYDHVFPAVRLAMNDEQGTEFLAGAIVNRNTGRVDTGRVEASRRLGDDWKASLEADGIFEPESKSLLNGIKDDDYVTFGLTTFF